MFYGHGHEMEYDFVVRPGGDPNQIRLAFDGVESMQVDANTGDLVIKTKNGSEMRHVQPKVYQQVGNRKVEVAGGYQLLDGQAAFRLLWSATPTRDWFPRRRIRDRRFTAICAPTECAASAR